MGHGDPGGQGLSSMRLRGHGPAATLLEWGQGHELGILSRKQQAVGSECSLPWRLQAGGLSTSPRPIAFGIEQLRVFVVL